MGWLSAIFPGLGESDEAAMRAAQSGDAAAFGRLVRKWEGPIGRLCTRMTGDADRGENLAQETFARAFTRRAQFAEGKRFSTWLWQVAINLCREELRKAGRRGEVALGGREVRERGPSPAERAEARERAELVRAALADLPEELREVVVLREYEGLRFREIAAVLELPEGTVKWRMAEGLDLLARRLGPRLGEGRTREVPAPANQ